MRVLNCCFIVSAIIVSSFFSPYQSKNAFNGIYVYRTFAEMPNSNELSKLLPDDSIFYNNGFALEKIMGIHEMIVDNKSNVTEKPKGFCFIDFSKGRFFSIDSISQANRIKSPEWKKISEKKVGLNFNFSYYIAEKYTLKDTVINKLKYKLMRYVSEQTGQNKGALMTVYINPTLESPSFFPNIENKIKGRVSMISVTYPNNQGRLWVTIEAKKHLRNRTLTDVNDIITKLNLK